MTLSAAERNRELLRLRKLSLVAASAALIFAASWAFAFLPNVKLTFLITFLVGYLWGWKSGAAAGMLGTFLWSLFNPYGPSTPPMLLVQLLGMGLVGLFGAAGYSAAQRIDTRFRFGLLALCGLIATLLYFIPVNAFDGYLFQPFWPRFWMGMVWTVWPLVMNCVLFPLVVPVVVKALATTRIDSGY